MKKTGKSPSKKTTKFSTKKSKEKMGSYDPSKIEKKWQKKWATSKIYATKEDKKKDKYYILDMFPYPSGEGLHVGHPKGYIATDVISRFQRMNGKSVLHPMGFDAFGLPAENYALKMKLNPADAMKKNVARFKKQLEIIGLDYDWSREINTTDPKYYKWTQWIFLQLFKKGLAYQSYEPINWCPSCKTGLANEDLEDGRCERCGTLVEKKPMRQWVLKITDFADRLLKDLDAEEYEMPRLIDKVNPHQEGKPIVTRKVAHAIVYDPGRKKYLIIRNKKFGWDTVIIGGIEGNEEARDTAIRELREETGYIDLEFKRYLGGATEAHYYTKHKGENRIATARGVYFELHSDKRVPIGADEDKDNEIIWIDEKDFVPGKMVNLELPVWLERIKDPTKGWPKALLDWPESIKIAQKNWIGRSEGALIKFEIRSRENEVRSTQKEEGAKEAKKIEVFTTRPDTLFGVTYVVLAPEHKLIGELLNGIENKKEVEQYVSKAKNKTEIERTDEKKEKDGVPLKGVMAINPANNEEIPVWVSDYVLADYGTGAVMAVPAHDERDWEFAIKFDLPVKFVISKNYPLSSTNPPLLTNAYSGKGFLIASGQFNGKDSESAKKEITSFVGGQWVTKYKLRDWVFSRQRYWGEPIPVIHCQKCALEQFRNQAVLSLNFYFKEIWDALKNGTKTLETRALNPEETSRYFGNTKVGDILHFIFKDKGKSEELLFRIMSKKIYKSFQELFDDKEALKKLARGNYASVSHLEKSYAYTSDYIERIKNNGLIAWEIEPITVPVPVPEKDLPVTLPRVKSYEPTGTGESPLASIKKWVETKCPACEEKKKKTKYLVFDFDGVLGDTWKASLATRLAMDKSFTEETVVAEMMKYFNNKPHHTKGNERTPEQIAEDIEWTEKFGKELIKREFELFKTFVFEIKKLKNIRCAVVSSGSSVYVKPALKKSGIKFSHILTFEDHHSKEEKISRITKDWNIQPQDIYYFTDTKADIYELENYLDKRRIIGCSWGFCGYNALKEVLPEKQILKNFTDIRSLFNFDSKAKRETNTMPQWAGSSWYYLRYEDPKNGKKLVDAKKEKYWSPVDLYVGGAEHATRHLIYARFWHKFLYDIGIASTTEPFRKLQHVGLIMGEDGRKMSKRFGNVVNPDDIVKTYGADTLRVYEMFMGPFDQQISWNTSSMIGARRFIEKVWKLKDNISRDEKNSDDTTGSGKTDKMANKILHRAVKKVTDDIGSMRFNTAISALMIAVNELEKTGTPNRSQYEMLLKLISPFAPHVADELWSAIGNKRSIHAAEWPKYMEELAADREARIIVQVNGKVRGSFMADPTSSKEELEKRAAQAEGVQKWLSGKPIQRVIVIPNRLVNFVI